MISGLTLSIALTVISVPPYERTTDHTQPYKWGQPMIRYFHRRPVDDCRRAAWEAYVQQTREAWNDYADSEGTLGDWEAVKVNIRMAKRDYVYQDPYLAPVVPRPR